MTMTPSNVSAHLCILSGLEPEHMRNVLQKALLCELTEADGEAYDEAVVFRGFSLGMILLVHCKQRKTKNSYLYEIVVRPSNKVFDQAGERLDINFHFLKLLKASGLENVCTHSDYIQS